ncbi:MAG: peptidase S41 [Desulfobacteraceae bacterium 4572_123]|nr:MAG: peptidase S41 [Desulfobacteraceae bacterium 4572_123]
MTVEQKHHMKLWPMLVAAVIFWTIAAGFFQNLSAGNDETYEGLKLFTDVVELVEKNYVDPVETKELLHKAIQGMVQGLDPHSALLPPEAFEELQVDTHGEFGGIGIVIEMKERFLTVVSPIEGTPAYKAGIQARDIIIKVDGQPTKDMMLWEAVKKMRGAKGTSVVITVMRKGTPKPIDFTLVRDIIPIESVRAIVLETGYGYVRVSSFSETTTADLETALAGLENGPSPLKGLVLDLRGNPGGLLPQAIKVSDLFLEKGDILSIKGRLEKNTKVFKAHPDSTGRNYPLVVLINGGSASASEIVAGALQDHKRALILGTTSFGKGTVQTVETLRDGYGLKLTIARYYTPSGRSIQAKGIEPDIEVRPMLPDEAAGDEQEEHLLKEKDLQNHLNAEPGPEDTEVEAGGNIEKTKNDEAQKPKRRQSRYRYGPLDIDELMADNQVKRALEILISYNIFQNVKK